MAEETKDEAKQQPEAEAKAAEQAKPEASAEAKPEAKPEAAHEPKAEAKAAAKGEAKAAEGQPEGSGAEGEQPAAPVRRRIKGAKNVPVGIVHIRASFNNTQVSITDTTGALISWNSAGRCGFKGSRKSTAYAATIVAQEAARQAVGHGMHEVEVRVQGPGAGRESAIRAVQAAGLTVTAIRDVTPMPHNGCRPPKRRRV